MDLLIHGIYDALTLKTLNALGVHRLGFDLRGRSPNLIPFYVLKELIPFLATRAAYLSFENEQTRVVESFLSLLGEHRSKFILAFRDQLPAQYYEAFEHPFTWMFNPAADWSSIIALPKLEALVLPLKLRQHYENLPQLWHQLQEREVPVILQVDSFADLSLYVHEKNLTLSVDLGRDMECGFRKIDHARLQNLSIWRKSHATVAGQ